MKIENMQEAHAITTEILCTEGAKIAVARGCQGIALEFTRLASPEPVIRFLDLNGRTLLDIPGPALHRDIQKLLLAALEKHLWKLDNDFRKLDQSPAPTDKETADASREPQAGSGDSR